MINLASLTALIRTLRQGPDAPAVPVARVPPVASLTPEDRPGSGGAAGAVQAWTPGQARSLPLIDEQLLGAAVTRRRCDDDPDSAHRTDTPRRPVETESRSTIVAAHVRSRTASASSARVVPQPPVDSAPLELTDGGKVLQSVLRGSSGAAPMPPAIVADAPLVGSARALPSELARALHQSLAESGLFYESHLARWVRREYPASALEREPQGRWSNASPLPAMPDASSSATAVNDSTSQLLTRQLDALDTRAVVWSGQLWPGQHATVAFEEDRDVSHDDVERGRGASLPAWRTRVVLELPSLGRIEATLALRGGTLDLMLEADNQDAHGRLAEAHDTLAVALSDSRVQLGNFAVAVHAR